MVGLSSMGTIGARRLIELKIRVNRLFFRGRPASFSVPLAKSPPAFIASLAEKINQGQAKCHECQEEDYHRQFAILLS